MNPAYKITEGQFETRDGLKLHFRHYAHPGSTDTMLFLHGHGEHSGRYDKFAPQLWSKNLSLAFFDIRGYGLSEGEHCYVRRFSEYLADFSLFVTHLEKAFDLKAPFYVFGHSNGGLQAAHWALENPNKTKALFLSSPFLGLKLPPLVIWLNQLICFLAPHFVYQNPVYPPYLTHNLSELEIYKKDPLIRRKITARLLSEMISSHHLLEAKKEIEVPFPVFVLMSGLDRIVDPKKTHLFYGKVKAPLKDLKVFEGLYHEIFNELGQEKVFEILGRQIDAARLKGF